MLRYEVNVVDDDSPSIQDRAPPWETAAQGKWQANQSLHLRTGVRGVVEAIVLQALAYGLSFIGVNSPIQNIVAGIVLVIAVGFDSYNRRRGMR